MRSAVVICKIASRYEPRLQATCERQPFRHDIQRLEQFANLPLFIGNQSRPLLICGVSVLASAL